MRSGFENFIAEIVEKGDGECADIEIVLDDHDPFAARRWRARIQLGIPLRPVLRGGARQVYPDGASSTNPATDRCPPDCCAKPYTILSPSPEP